MNIMAPFADPVKSAHWLDDQRQVKMPMEAAQMLSTTLYLHGVWTPPLYKPTHAWHPCTQWVCQGRDNWEWLWEHMIALDDARLSRITVKATAQAHDGIRRLELARAWRFKKILPYGGTPHVNCTRHKGLGIDFTHVDDVHLAYRKYLKARWLAQDKPAVCTIRSDEWLQRQQQSASLKR